MPLCCTPCPNSMMDGLVVFLTQYFGRIAIIAQRVWKVCRRYWNVWGEYQHVPVYIQTLSVFFWMPGISFLKLAEIFKYPWQVCEEWMKRVDENVWRSLWKWMKINWYLAKIVAECLKVCKSQIKCPKNLGAKFYISGIIIKINLFD